jgi:hypothetical protein
LRELAKYLYKSPKSAFKEAVSNALDQMAKDHAKVEIYTDVLPDGDIVIEDWGTGIEDYERFKHIAIGDKIVDGRISSYEIIDENIIGQRGLGKLSFLNLSSIATVEFYSHSPMIIANNNFSRTRYRIFQIETSYHTTSFQLRKRFILSLACSDDFWD